MNYWITRVPDEYYLGEAIKNKYFLAQFRYDANDKLNRVTIFLKAVSEVKQGDVLFLTCKEGGNSFIYAYGFAVECPYESDQVSDLNKVISNNEHDYNSGIVRFYGNPVFYENLEGGCDNYGQRINVERWCYYSNPARVSTSGINFKGGANYDTILGVENVDGEKLMKTLRNEYFKKYKGVDIQKISELMEEKKNIILQGAPGTGKTYNTAAIALSVLGETDVDLNNHQAVMDRYELLQKEEEQRIFFTTFHQSLDYEDFVEGMKPNVEEGDVTYKIEDGIFKQACKAVHSNIEDFIDDYINKIKGRENKREIPTITNKSSVYVWQEKNNTTISVRSVNSNSKSEDYMASLNIKEVKERAIKGKNFKCDHHSAYIDAFVAAVKREYGIKGQEKAVVLIIDEINRGNVSKIFGELITLIETDKREEGRHPIKATLPYSKDSFSVPSKLYIIGTMNTTDRSTGTLDYALRRRFAFYTLKSDKNVVKKHYASNNKLGDKAVALFENIEKFIINESCGDYDIDDLMVGHSYFMAESENELCDKMKYEVIPLIKEYMNDGILNVDKKKANEVFNKWLVLETANI